ncbi:MAG TPA: hypothetical protein VLT91_08990 [Rhizomicrobium sp.]|nr:hypothetical protein [Rhizomicrobium sp.]
MHFKTILLGTAALALLAVPAVAQDAPKKHHHHHATAASGSIDARIDALEAEIHDLKRQQAAQGQAAAEAPAPSDQQVSAAQFEALQNQVYEQQAANTALVKGSWWANTKISGRMYFDLTNVDSKSSGVKNPQEGFHFDVKRFYLGIDHQFNDIFSANLTTDFTYDTSQCNGITTTTDPVTGHVTSVSCTSSGSSASQLFVKKAYLQAKLADWAIFRAGAADMPWIPFAEDMYGYRYVENTLVDRFKEGNSSDWGAFFLGSVGSDLKLEYSFAAINGAGYKKPAFGLGTNRSNGMDFEGRADVRYDDFVLAVGGYSGKLGKELTPNTTTHTASRFDALAAYEGDGFHVGVEYYSQDNWNSVTSGSTDKGDGWSAFGAYQFTPEWAVFGRYDDAKPKKVPGTPDYSNKYYNFGIEYTPTKIVNLSLVYKHDEGKNGVFTDQNGPIGGTGLTPKGSYNEIGLFGQLRW